MLLERGKERGVRTAVAHRHAEPLRVAEHDVGAQFARRLEQRQAQQIGRDRDERRPRRFARAMNGREIATRARSRPASARSAPNTSIAERHRVSVADD